MNKKQKILTVVALTVFAAIIGLHYCTGIHYQGPYRILHHMDLEMKEYAIRQGNKLIWADAGPDPTYPNSPELKRVLLEHPGAGWYLSSGIKDVRMPLFALAVFYAGLFFILATPRAKGP
jgi:hypothetical protein